MGSNQSSNHNKYGQLFFANIPDFWKKKRKLKEGYRFDLKRIWCCDSNEDYCVYSTLHKPDWFAMLPNLKNKAIKDFIDTIYFQNYSFDDLYDLCSSDCLWYLECPHQKNMILSPVDRQQIAEELLRFAFANRIQYCHRRGNDLTLENLIDLPLKTYGVCGCSSRPLYVAVHFCRPDIVRLLLNCGASIPLKDVCKCGGRKCHPLKNSLNNMKNMVRFEKSKTVTNYRERSVYCLWILLAELPHTSELYKTACELLDKMARDDFVKAEKIPTLKHIVRTQIRICMKGNRTLCNANVFEELGMPKCLETYMNIEEANFIHGKLSEI